MGVFKQKNKGSSGKGGGSSRSDKKRHINAGDRKKSRKANRAAKHQDSKDKANARKLQRIKERKDKNKGIFSDLGDGIGKVFGATAKTGNSGGASGGGYGVSDGNGNWTESDSGKVIEPGTSVELSDEQNDEHVEMGGRDLGEHSGSGAKVSDHVSKASKGVVKGFGTVVEAVYGFGK